MPLSFAGVPIIGAPMAGGPSTPALVAAVNDADGLGFLAAGLKTVAALTDEIAAVRATGQPFGVNVFAARDRPIDRDAVLSYAQLLQPEAERYGVELPPPDLAPDDDRFRDKIDLLLAQPVPFVSFTFGIPDSAVIASLRRAGSVVLVTVTSAAEAVLAAERKADALVVQSAAAGGHRGTSTPEAPNPVMDVGDLLAEVLAVSSLPLIAAGGISDAEAAARAIRSGASAVAIGTALLRTDESGASAAHKDALGDPHRQETLVTRAFSGRPGRSVRNRFAAAYTEAAPLAYPMIAKLFSPIRAAAAAQGDADGINLWAGTGYRRARVGPAADVVAEMARRL